VGFADEKVVGVLVGAGGKVGKGMKGRKSEQKNDAAVWTSTGGSFSYLQLGSE